MAAAVALPVKQTIVAASYERVSTRVQGQTGFSLIAQHQSGEEFVRAHGWQMPSELRFRDGDEANASGADWDLPGLTAMMEAARRGEFSVLVVPDLDRFARSMVKGLVLEEQLRKYGVRVIYQRVPTDDTPEGNLLKHQLLSFAEYEREKIRLRTTMGRRTKAQTGKVVGNGVAPYGHRFVMEILDSGRQRVTSLEPDPIAAPIVVRMVRMACTASTWEIATTLTDEGIPSPHGGRWTPKVVHRIVTNRTHVGEWRFSDITVPVAPLMAKDDNRTPTPEWLAEWNAAQEAMTERSGRSGPRVARVEDEYLLRGLLTCGHCGSLLRSSPNGKSRVDGSLLRYYLCGCHAPWRARRLNKPVCDLPDVPAAALEAEVWAILSTTLLDPEMLMAGLESARTTHLNAGRVQQDRLETIDAEIAKQRKSLETLAEKLTTTDAGEFLDAIMRRAKDVEATIAKLNAERGRMASNPGPGLSDKEAEAIRQFAESARAGLELATPAEKRQLLESLRLRGRVHADPNGVRLGRRNSFRIEWEAKIPLLHTETGFLKRDRVESTCARSEPTAGRLAASAR